MTVQVPARENEGPSIRIQACWWRATRLYRTKELAKNRTDLGAAIKAHPLDDQYHRDRSPDWSKINVPLLSSANWGGQGLHPRGNFEGFVRSASKQKWLEVHGIEHWTEFYTRYGVTLQKRFFDHFLKGIDNEWKKQPRVQLQVRKIDGFVQRMEKEWPLARTRWTKFYLNPADCSLARNRWRREGGLNMMPSATDSPS